MGANPIEQNTRVAAERRSHFSAINHTEAVRHWINTLVLPGLGRMLVGDPDDGGVMPRLPSRSDRPLFSEVEVGAVIIRSRTRRGREAVPARCTSRGDRVMKIREGPGRA